jgi:hypothetical protein
MAWTACLFGAKPAAQGVWNKDSVQFEDRATEQIIISTLKCTRAFFFEMVWNNVSVVALPKLLRWLSQTLPHAMMEMVAALCKGKVNKAGNL